MYKPGGGSHTKCSHVTLDDICIVNVFQMGKVLLSLLLTYIKSHEMETGNCCETFIYVVIIK